MRTPLFDLHCSLGARMAPFAGWDMPIQYAGILAEHHHTRQEASVFDTCHMGEFDLRGPAAEADLERLVSLNVATIPVGRCRYGYLLNERGGVIDDLTVYRRPHGAFLVVVNAGTRQRNAEWMRAHLSGGTHFTDLSDELAKLDVQGPHAKAAIEAAMGEALPDLRYFSFAEQEWGGVLCTISRTGYTGEWGYEFYFPAEDAVRIWEQLTAPGWIKPAGLGARDTLRLEVGYPLNGHEFSEDATPAAVSRGQFIDLGKEFIGRAAVQRDLENGPEHLLVGLRLAGKRAARAGDAVRLGDASIGTVSSGSLAPSLGCAVAMAFVARGHAQPGTALAVESRGALLPAEVVEMPFYREGTARLKTPPTP